MSPRGDTGFGKPALLPPSNYSPRPMHRGTTVDFVGEDGRSCSFDAGALPLPDWHESLAASWAARVGPAGTLRTRSSATGAWGAVTRFVRFLGQTLRPPAHPHDLSVEHVDAFLRFRTSSAGERQAKLELRSVALTFQMFPLAEAVSAEVRDRMRPQQTSRLNPQSGYSDGELARVVTAARADVAALRERLASVPFNAGELASGLDKISIADIFSFPGLAAPQRAAAKREVAEKLFVTRRDLTSMLVLLVAMTGWNIEVIKDLPAQHHVIEGLAVEVEVTKRRRGAGRWHKTVTWEIGPPGKELFTPGGVYLLLHRLMAPAREIMDDSTSFWAVWHQTGRALGEGCRNPFGAALDASLRNQPWVHEWGIRSDAAVDSAAEDAPILRLNFNRLKSSVDVRRTRQMGGHLPSAARTNTTGVLFSNYLAGDNGTIDWARDLVAEALVEVEQAAWSAHRRALAEHGVTSLQIRVGPPDDNNLAHQVDGQSGTAWTDCTDHEHHPLTGRRCSASFLDCFHCGNCIVTDEHLPRLLSLLDALELRRTQMSEDSWWEEYGSSWAAIRYEVLPKFSEAEINRADLLKPNDSLLDLVEPRWEQP